MATPKITVSEGAKAGFGILRSAWTGAPGALALSVVCSVLNMAGTGSKAPPLMAAGFLTALVADVVLAAAVYRIALGERGLVTRAGKPGLLGIQWRAAEWRLLAVRLLIYLVLAACLLVSAAALSLLAAAEGGVISTADGRKALMKSGAWIPLSGVAILAIVAACWLSLRLSLAPVMTVAEERVRFFAAMRLTRGYVWRLLGAMIVVALPMILVSVVAGFCLGLASSLGAVDVGRWLYRIVFSLGDAAYLLPSYAGVCAYAYAALDPQHSRLEAVFE